MIFTPGILFHKSHKTRGDQKSPPRGINSTITLINKISKPGGMWFPPRGFKFTNFKNPGGPISPPRGPNYTNNTMGRFQNPGDMISTRGINFILFKSCQILRPGGSNSSNNQAQRSQLKPRGHSIIQSSLFTTIHNNSLFTIWQFYNPGGYIDSGRGRVPSSNSQTRGASKKGSAYKSAKQFDDCGIVIMPN